MPSGDQVGFVTMDGGLALEPAPANIAARTATAARARPSRTTTEIVQRSAEETVNELFGVLAVAFLNVRVAQGRLSASAAAARSSLAVFAGYGSETRAGDVCVRRA